MKQVDVHPSLSLSLSPFPVALTLEHRTSVKRFVSLQFLCPRTVGRTPWTGNQPVAWPIPTQTQNKRTQTSMRRVGFEPTIPVLELAKTVDDLDLAATVIGVHPATRRYIPEGTTVHTSSYTR
jgi:hypothetical protein